MWAVARYDLGLTEEEFFDITPAQFFALVKRKNIETKEQDYRSGVIASNIVRVVCKQEDGKKYSPSYFFPSLRTDKEREAEASRSTPEGMKTALQSLFPPKRKE